MEDILNILDLNNMNVKYAHWNSSQLCSHTLWKKPKFPILIFAIEEVKTCKVDMSRKSVLGLKHLPIAIFSFNSKS